MRKKGCDDPRPEQLHEASVASAIDQEGEGRDGSCFASGKPPLRQKLCNIVDLPPFLAEC